MMSLIHGYLHILSQKFIKIFELIKSLCAKLFKTFSNISQVKMSQKLGKKHFVNYIKSTLYVLNYFKYFQIYILGHLSQKKSDKKNFSYFLWQNFHQDF